MDEKQEKSISTISEVNDMLSSTLILLKVVSTGGSLAPLRQRGFSPSQIFTLIQEQVKEGNIETSLDGIRITESGKEILSKYYKANKMLGSSQWIFPQVCYHRDPIASSKIILPKKKV